MADMCWHMLTLPTNKAIGLEMIEKFQYYERCQKGLNGRGQTFGENYEYLYSIEVDLPCDVCYETKFRHNANDILRLAKENNFDFVLSYEELNTDIFGHCKFENGEMFQRIMPESVIDEFEENEEGDEFIFRGEVCESKEDKLSELLAEMEWIKVEGDWFR